MNPHEEFFNPLDEMQEPASPLLDSIRRREPFEAPEGYFLELESRIFDRIHDEEALAEAPLLASAPRLAAPEPPKGYFEALPERILLRIRRESRSEGVVLPLFARPAARQWAAAAAVILLILSGVRSFHTAAPLPGADIEDMVSFAVEEVDESTLIEMLDEGAFSTLDRQIGPEIGPGSLDQLLEEVELDLLEQEVLESGADLDALLHTDDHAI
jgi:hypothetical protein